MDQQYRDIALTIFDLRRTLKPTASSRDAQVFIGLRTLTAELAVVLEDLDRKVSGQRFVTLAMTGEEEE